MELAVSTTKADASQQCAHLVESKNAEVSHDSDSAQTTRRCNFARNLQSNLHNLQRVREQHLTCSSLQTSHPKVHSFSAIFHQLARKYLKSR